jgi:hypothetical protein
MAESARANRWSDLRAFAKKRMISGLYPLSAMIPFGTYEQPEFWVSEAMGVCYVVNPKAACSSIQVALTQLATGTQIRDLRHNHPLVARFRRTSIRQVPASCFCFSFVRHPVERVISLYKEKFLRVRQERSPFEYDGYLRGLFKLADEFDEFCRKVANIPDRIADRHFVSQTFWFDNICGVRPQHIARLEDIDREWPAICRRIGQQADLPRLNSTRNIARPLTAPGSLRERYASDLRQFGYE